jgi:hypothetical protein
MNIQEYHYLQAQLKELNELIVSTPDDFVIERMGLEQRRDDIQTILSSVAAPNREPARICLTFRGKPIIGTKGIFAEFGAQAVSLFTDAVAAVGASLNNPLGARGVLPDKSRYNMLITGTAVGSFGFQLEEAPSQEQPTLFAEDSPVTAALEKTESVLKATLGSDDELTEELADIDPRAVDSLRKFLERLVIDEAVCAVTINERYFRFKDVGQVSRSLDRIRTDNIHETTLELTGIFEGYLPKRRQFQFTDSQTDETILGKVSNAVENPETINSCLGQGVAATFIKKTVGSGKPN